jgi:hypothetical protein
MALAPESKELLFVLLLPGPNIPSLDYNPR